MKSKDVDKLLFDYCRKHGGENASRDLPEQVDYYLLSKYIEGKTTEEENKQVNEMIARDPSLAELLEPIEELDRKTEADQYTKPIKLRPVWLPRILRLAACLAVIVTGFIWLTVTLNPSDDEIVVRSVNAGPATNVTEHATNSVNNTDTDI
jgi:hypothetical protein